MLAVSSIPAAPVVGLMGFAVMVAIAGHVTKVRSLVVLGLLMLFLATTAMMIFAFAAYRDDPADPRPGKPPSSPGF